MVQYFSPLGSKPQKIVYPRLSNENTMLKEAYRCNKKRRHSQYMMYYVIDDLPEGGREE
jgi:hypothetical protein